jgi:nitrogen fixation/metabolism regulation signal transduction histidine kinase
MLATESGHVEWMNPIAKEIVGESCLLQKSVVEAIDSNKEIVKLGGKEYALSHSLVTVSGSKRIIVAMKNIQSAMERTEVDSWHKLVRVLTHEIMNSITPIISLSETLCEMTNTNDSAEMLTQGLDVIHRRSQGLLNFVENYRKLTRVAMPDKTQIEVKGFFADLKKLYPQQFVTFDTGNNEDISIYADRGQMEQVMINLLKNAVEATASTAMPQIRCSCKKDNADNAGKAIITVEDNGQGILPDVLERIFVPFFTTKKNGSGIGLSLCKQIIMNHGGEISIESEDGKGSTVKIRI